MRRVVPVDPRDLGLSGVGEAPEQRPFAAVVGCSDARVPIELIFNEGPNDLFVVRVAGNGLGAEGLGSLEIRGRQPGRAASSSSWLWAIAVAARCPPRSISPLQPRSYLVSSPGSTRCAPFSTACWSSCTRARNVWPRYTVRTSCAAQAIGKRSSRQRWYRTPRLLRSRWTRSCPQASGDSLRSPLRRVAARVAPDLGAARLHSPECAGLAFPPADADAFDAYADAVARSSRIEAMLT